MKERLVTVIKKGVFDSAHANASFGEGHKCTRVHGHTFHFSIEVLAVVEKATGLSIDFGEIKKAGKNRVVDVLDHYFINEVPFFKENNIPPTAENIAQFIFNEVTEELQNKCPKTFRKISKVELWETPTSGVTVTEFHPLVSRGEFNV